MNVVVFCIESDKYKSKLQEFHRVFHKVSDKFEQKNAAVDKFLIGRGEQIMEQLRSVPDGHYHRIILIGHGVPKAWGRPGLYGIRQNLTNDKVVDAEDFAKLADIKCKKSAIIVFASCLCAASPKWYRNQLWGNVSEWAIPSHAPGGEKSLCGLVAKVSMREVRGHTTAAHTTENPCIRVFPAGNNKGISIAYMQDENFNYKSGKDRRKWNSYAKGEIAENLLIVPPR